MQNHHLKVYKSMVIHDTECPYWDQVSFNNTKPNQTIACAEPNQIVSSWQVQGCSFIMLTLTLPGPSAGVSGSLDSYCSLKTLMLGMGEVVPARTSPTLLPPSSRTVLSLSCFKVLQCINCRDWHCKSCCLTLHTGYVIQWFFSKKVTVIARCVLL